MFISKDPIDNKSALVQVMAWQQTGDKSLAGPRIAQIAINASLCLMC